MRRRKKRNAPLSKRQARALCAVVRRHGKRCRNPLTRQERAAILRRAREAAKIAHVHYVHERFSDAKAQRWYGEGLLDALAIGGGGRRWTYVTPHRRHQKITIRRARNGSSAKKTFRMARLAAHLRRSGKIQKALRLEEYIDRKVAGKPSLEHAAQLGMERGSFED